MESVEPDSKTRCKRGSNTRKYVAIGNGCYTKDEIQNFKDAQKGLKKRKATRKKKASSETKSSISEENALASVVDEDKVASVVDEDKVASVVDEDKVASIVDEIPIVVNETHNNELLKKNEKEEYEYNKKNEDPDFDALYPTINDPFFSEKISRRKEYENMKYDGDIRDIEGFSNYLCENSSFELMPHQLFIRNFISRNTPYNSILLYHGLGSGKTCSAIGIAEEMREYAKQTGTSQHIMVIASTNVQDNFRLQLFDERNLKQEVNNNWTIKSCIGNKLLKEMNPTGENVLQKENIISQANTIINNNYTFMGYLQLANFIIDRVMVPTTAAYTSSQKNDIEIQNIKKHFNNRLIIIDEIHNIHLNDSKKDTKIAKLLLKVAKYADNMKLVLLSATPVYNSVKEIIWLTNLMNVNDKRAEIEQSDVFTADGSFVKGKENGDALLRRKLTGYVSYVRGENPYTFPFRVYPDTFAPDKTFLNKEYPLLTMSNKKLSSSLKYLNGRLYINQIGEEQEKGYKFIVENMIKNTTIKGDALDESNKFKDPNFERMESYGYSHLQAPLQALIMTFPSALLNRVIIDSKTKHISKEMLKEVTNQIVGKEGLRSVMNFVEENLEIELNPGRTENEEKRSYTVFKKYNFEYKPGIERIFHKDHIHKYSSKISNICDRIRISRGIVLIYTQYIDGGIVPMALALEEMGFTRYGTGQHVTPLFKKLTTRNIGPRTQVDPLNAVDLLPLSTVGKSSFSQAKYMILSGDKYFSHNNAEDIKIATDKANIDGRNVRVIIISKAASEGLDFKFIRQVHILDPWYNMNRIEQIIGRGVRNMSHCGLAFKERNVEIYLHATVLSEEKNECADLYVYRYAEKKAIDIGIVNRIMKSVSVDCILNVSQIKLTCSNLNGKDDKCEKTRKITDKSLNAISANQRIKIHSSTCEDPEGISFLIGDKPFTEACDYMECDYTCPVKDITKRPTIIEATYGKDFITSNSTVIIEKIKELYSKKDNIVKSYHRKTIDKLLTSPIGKFGIIPNINTKEIDFALTKLIDNQNETIIDSLGRTGRLVNRGNYYIFQPIEIRDNRSSILESSLPVHKKEASIKFEIIKKDKIRPPDVEEAEEQEQEQEQEKDEQEDLDEEVIEKEQAVEPAIEKQKEKKISDLLIYLQKKLDIIKREPENIPATNLDWYIHLNSIGKEEKRTKKNPNPIKPISVKEHIRQKFGHIFNITDEDIEKYSVFHMLDTLIYPEKVIIAKHIVSIKAKTELELYILEYFKPLIFKDEDEIKILIAKYKKNMGIYKDPETAQWEEFDPDDDSKFRAEVSERFKQEIHSFSEFLGFVGTYEKKGVKFLGFQIKNMSQKKNNTGAYLQNYVKKEVIKKINMLIDILSKTHKNLEHYSEKIDISQVALCAILEIIFRKLNDDDKTKVWFLSIEEGIENRIEAI
jgi:hypothetical protein